MIFQDPSTALNRRLPVHRVLRDPLDVHRRGTVAQRNERVRELMALVGLPAERRRRPARPVVRRPAATRRDRPGPGARAVAPGRRRADQRSRRLGPGPDPQPAAGPEGTPRPGHGVRLPRHPDRPPDERPGGHDVPRPDRRAGAGRPAIARQARHPYTRALFSATPGLISPIDPIPLVGPVPSATRPPSGCPFRTRCWKADDTCAGAMPEFESDAVDPAHLFRCYHPVVARRVHR